MSKSVSSRLRLQPLFVGWVTYLEQVFGDDVEALAVVTDALQVGVLIEDCVVDVQEQVEGILVQ